MTDIQEADIREVKQGNEDRLICPYCGKRISWLGVAVETKMFDVTVICSKCKKILKIKI